MAGSLIKAAATAASLLMAAAAAGDDSPFEKARRLAISRKEQDKRKALDLFQGLAHLGDDLGERALMYHCKLSLDLGGKSALAGAMKMFTLVVEKGHALSRQLAQVGKLRVLAEEGKEDEAAFNLAQLVCDLKEGKPIAQEVGPQSAPEKTKRNVDTAVLSRVTTPPASSTAGMNRETTIAVDAAYYLGWIEEKRGRLQSAGDLYRYALDMLMYLQQKSPGLYCGLLGEDEIRERLARLNRDPAAEGLAKALYERARQMEKGCDYPGARKTYGEISAKHAETKFGPASTVGIGRCYLLEWKPDEADKILSPFIVSDPRGPHRAEALILLGDVELLGRFRVSQAMKYYQQGADYETTLDPSWREVRWQAEERVGTAHFVMGRQDEALKHYERSQTLIEGNDASDRLRGLGIKVLVGFCRDRWFPTPKFLLNEGSERVRAALVIADAWYESLDFERARNTYAFVTDRKQLGAEATPDQRVYAGMQTGVILDNTFHGQEAIDLYKRLIRDNPQGRLLDEVMFRLSCVTFNQFQDARWREAAETMIALSRRLPNSKRAPEALYVAGFMLASKGRLEETRALEKEMRARYPNSIWLQTIQECITASEAEVTVKSAK